jgi:hypothetical protein
MYFRKYANLERAHSTQKRYILLEWMESFVGTGWSAGRKKKRAYPFLEGAQMLSYSNHASFVLEERMAKNPENVNKFLTDLLEKLQPVIAKVILPLPLPLLPSLSFRSSLLSSLRISSSLSSSTSSLFHPSYFRAFPFLPLLSRLPTSVTSKKDLDALQSLKKEELQKANPEEPNLDLTINGWDFSYYMNQLLEKEYKVDETKISEYFPLHVVLEGLLGIYQEILGA